jgi:ketosteroid isomerase-like protein
MYTLSHFSQDKKGIHNDRLRIASNFFTALKTHDWDLLRSILVEEATWDFPGSSLLSGKAFGAEAVVKKAPILAGFSVLLRLHHIFLGYPKWLYYYR